MSHKANSPLRALRNNLLCERQQLGGHIDISRYAMIVVVIIEEFGRERIAAPVTLAP